MACILHITQEGYDKLKRLGLIDEYGIKSFDEASYKEGYRKGYEDAIRPAERGREQREPRKYDFEQLVCPCNTLSDFPQNCPYHGKVANQPVVITSDNTAIR